MKCSVERFQDKVNWGSFLEGQKLSEGFIENFQDKVHWNSISENLKVSEGFIVLEWFLDWFFGELLMKGKTEKALEARETLIKFSMACEDMTRDEAINKIDSNFEYYSNHEDTTWRPKWNEFKRIIKEKRIYMEG